MAKGNDEKIKLIERLSIVVALYKELQTKFNKEQALEIMRKIIIPIGYNESRENFQSLENSHKKPMELLITYFNLIDTKGVGQFSTRKMTYDDNKCYRVVTKCPFHGLFTEEGTPELTKLFCEVDREFYIKAFPKFEFHQNGSWENTIAYRKDHCEFVFERKM